MTARNSIGRQAAIRLFASLGLLVALIAIGSVGIYQAALRKAGHQRAEELASFYRARLDQIEREWEIRSRDFKVRIETTRALETPATAAANLQAFITIQGAERPFHYLLIQTGDGKKLFDFGKNLSLPAIPNSADVTLGHYEDELTHALYRVIEHPIWLGEERGMGRFAVFFRIDNALLLQMGAPGLTLSALHGGVTLASSGGAATLERLRRNEAGVNTDQEILYLPWYGDPATPVALRIEAPIITLFSTAELAVTMSLIPVIDGLVLWLTIGLWLMRQTRRVTALGHALDSYAADKQATTAMATTLASARQGPDDEITEVADAIGAMTSAIEQRAREQQETAAKLQDSEARFRQLFNCGDDAIFVTERLPDGRPGRLVEVNDIACRRLGYTREELLRMSPDDIDAPGHGRADDPEFLHRLREHRQTLIERVHVARDGRHIPVEINVQSFTLNGRDAILGVARDISERRQAEAEYRTIVETAHDGFWIVAVADGRFLDVNPAACAMIGYSREEMLTLGVSDVEALERPEETRRHIAALIAGREEHFESRHRRKDGKLIDVEVSGKFIDLRGGAIVVFIRDVTARKAAADALIEAKQLAERANSAKSVFLANMSHEIRTPLHVITGFGQLLRRDLADPVQRERVDQLCATADHLLAIVDDILDLSKIEAGQLVLDHRSFRLDSVVDKVVRMAGAAAHKKGLMLATDIAPDLRGMALNGDAVRLAQVLINLCGNAVKFTDQGAVRLGIGCLAQDAACVTVRFSVEDSGIGIALAEQARLFRPFTQVDTSSTRERGGTGLGLAISQRLVTLMGGTIRVYSRPGVGSTFGFELVMPRAKAMLAPAPVPAAPAKNIFGGRQVLFAEDHPLSQEIILEMLADLGCEGDVAADGAEAVACAQARGYDLILMDLQMPKMDGLAATRAIRALPEHRHTPIIALTANAFADDRQRCLDAGMNDHLGKPMTLATLAAMLGQWLPDLPVPADAPPACDNALSRALAAIPELEVAQTWQSSAEQLAVYGAQLDVFLTMHGNDMARLREFLAAGECDAAHVVVHNLKGIAGLIGARRVAALASEITIGLRRRAAPETLTALAGECEAALARLTEAARKLS